MTKTMTAGLAFIIVFFTGLPAFAQDFAGYKSSNYTGVNGVYYNPANIVDSPYNWDFNLFGVSAFLGNDQVALSREEIFQLNGDRIKERFLSSDVPVSGIGNVLVNGPSLMFHIGKRSAVAIFTRSHVLVNAENIDSKLTDQIIGDNNSQITFPYTISSSQTMKVNLNAYTEFGLSYAHVFYSKGKSLLKVGITLKYLAGTANGYIHINRLHTTIKKDKATNESYITNTKDRLALGLGGINLSNFKVNDLFDFKSTGFGGDIGFIYEYRAHPQKSYSGLNKYKLKIGVSLLDLGGIKYKRDRNSSGAYNIHIPNGKRFYLSTLSNTDIDHIKETLDQYPQYFTETGADNNSTYKVSLPASLHLDIDYHVGGGFYLNLTARKSLTSLSDNVGSGKYYNYVTLTPRIESKHFGLFVPVTYNSLTELNAGIAFRLGPFYLGSGSILTAAFDNTKQADVYFGIHFGGLE